MKIQDRNEEVMKRIYIETLGCSKNQVDSEQMLGMLDDYYELSETAEEADVVVVNTCSFINDAKEESIQVILGFVDLKNQGVIEKLLVTGCLSQRYPDELLKEIPEIDALIGTSAFHKIVEVIDSLYKGSKTQVFMESIDLVMPEDIPRVLTTESYTAFIKISEGCDNSCTYCIIPKLRGKYRSRKMEDILDEMSDLAALGVKEFIIIAQDTSRYGLDLYGKPMLPELLTQMDKIEGVHWIRVQYSYPDILDDDMLDGFFKNEKVVNYFDIPIQHASDKILKLMNRKTSKEDILRIVDKIRSRDAEAVIRTTVIVGFPGETEEDFQELIDLAKRVKFDRLGAFAYSNEEDTAAYNLPHHLEEEVKEERKNRLMATQMGISETINAEKIGKTYEVVIEEVAETGKILVGRTAYDAPEIDGVVYVHTTEEIPAGTFIKVKVTDALEYDLIGVIDNEYSK